MRMAIEKAREGVSQGQTPFAACIVLNGEVLSCCHNVVWQTTDITAHGEIHAIRQACLNAKTIDLSGAVLYSTCEPCPMCFAAIHWARIAKVIYGATIADAKQAGFHELTISNEQMKSLGGSEVEIEGGFLREENVKVFEYFLSRANKKVY
ncbi:MAG: nucleoside deaminase [Candidatus Omnitrophica bacterium]|nr:nucleoside deaminase [Candidatus Omnitrophota bacterium]